jgi:hypothetical protein
VADHADQRFASVPDGARHEKSGQSLTVVLETVALQFKKFFLYGAGLVLALTGPISLFTGSDMLAGAKQHWFNWTGFSGTKSSNPAATSAPYVPPASQLSAAIPTPGAPPTAAGLPMASMAEAFNFDATIDWVTRRWPRVSTGLAQVQLQGYRVPLTTGTGPTDLAGSLTYYFNSQQKVGRITFHGVTGDASALVAFLSSRYQFARRLTNDPGMILYEAVDESNQSLGQARIRTSSVISVNQPHSRFAVDLTINRPG